MPNDIHDNVMELTDREKKLIKIIRNSEHSELKIIIQDKQPIRIEEVLEEIEL